MKKFNLVEVFNLFACNTHYITVLSHNDGKPCGRSNVYSDFVNFYLCDVVHCWVGKGADGPELFVVIKEPF